MTAEIIASDSIVRRRRQLRLLDDVAASPIKWAGGKRRMVPTLIPMMPTAFRSYYEPFAGGAAVFFALRPLHAVLADVNPDLVEFWRELREDPVGLRSAAAPLFSAHGAATYYGTREGWNRQRQKWTSQRRAGALLYLNKACFNGLWRVNRDGDFNVPIGKSSRGPALPARDNWRWHPRH